MPRILGSGQILDKQTTRSENQCASQLVHQDKESLGSSQQQVVHSDVSPPIQSATGAEWGTDPIVKIVNRPSSTSHTLDGPTPIKHRVGQTCPLMLLPTELKVMIAENVESPRSLSSLSKACLVLREIVLPILFRDLKVGKSEYWRPTSVQAVLTTQHGQQFADMIESVNIQAMTKDESFFVLELLKVTPNLTRLEVHYGINQEPDSLNVDTGVRASKLSSALSNVRNTLRHLCISYELCEGPEYGDKTVHGYCSLQQLRVLESLEIPFLVLLGWSIGDAPKLADVLPRSLKNLKFGDDEWGIDWLGPRSHQDCWGEASMMRVFTDYFGDMVWNETTPDLRQVTLSLISYDDAWDDCILQREWRENEGERDFKQLCQENGLECIVLRNHWAPEWL